VSSRHEAKYYKTLRVRRSVRVSDSFACIGAGTARVGNFKQVRSTQYQFILIRLRVFIKRGLFHVIAQALFRQDRDVVVS